MNSRNIRPIWPSCTLSLKPVVRLDLCIRLTPARYPRLQAQNSIWGYNAPRAHTKRIRLCALASQRCDPPSNFNFPRVNFQRVADRSGLFLLVARDFYRRRSNALWTGNFWRPAQFRARNDGKSFPGYPALRGSCIFIVAVRAIRRTARVVPP